MLGCRNDSPSLRWIGSIPPVSVPVQVVRLLLGRSKFLMGCTGSSQLSLASCELLMLQQFSPAFVLARASMCAGRLMGNTRIIFNHFC